MCVCGYLFSHLLWLLFHLLDDLIAGAAIIASCWWAVLFPLLQTDPAKIVLALEGTYGNIRIKCALEQNWRAKYSSYSAVIYMLWCLKNASCCVEINIKHNMLLFMFSIAWKSNPADWDYFVVVKVEFIKSQRNIEHIIFNIQLLCLIMLIAYNTQSTVPLCLSPIITSLLSLCDPLLPDQSLCPSIAK